MIFRYRLSKLESTWWTHINADLQVYQRNRIKEKATGLALEAGYQHWEILNLKGEVVANGFLLGVTDKHMLN